MSLPPFLAKKPEQREITEFEKALQRYEEHFGEIDFNTINTGFTDDEYVAIISYCIKENKHYTDVFGPYDPEAIY